MLSVLHDISTFQEFYCFMRHHSIKKLPHYTRARGCGDGTYEAQIHHLLKHQCEIS